MSDFMSGLGGTMSGIMDSMFGAAPTTQYAHAAKDGGFINNNVAEGAAYSYGPKGIDGISMDKITPENYNSIKASYDGSAVDSSFNMSNLKDIGNAYYGIKNQQMRQKEFDSNEAFKKWLKEKEDKAQVSRNNMGAQLSR